LLDKLNTTNFYDRLPFLVKRSKVISTLQPALRSSYTGCTITDDWMVMPF